MAEIGFEKRDFRMVSCILIRIGSFAHKHQRITVGDFQVVFCMDRALEYAPSCHKFKILKAECLALLGRYPEAQSVARYNHTNWQPESSYLVKTMLKMFANVICPRIVIFSEWTQLMQTPCMFVVSVCIMRTALTRPSSSLSKLCAWLLTTKRLDWHAEWVYLYATMASTVVFKPKWRHQMKCSLRFLVIFVIQFNRVMLKVIIFAECQSTESQEGGGEQGV